MDILPYAQNGVLKVFVKPNKMQSVVEGYDSSRNAVIIHISAPSDKDKANRELVRFLSRMLKKRVEIVKGMRGREKYVKII